jgi:hypothetical protein
MYRSIRHQRPISSGSIERYPDVAVDLWNVGTVMPVRNALKDSRACSWSKGQFTALMVFMMDALKDLRVDMGENFPYPGPCDRMKASILPQWGCFIAVSAVTARYGVCLWM